MNKFHHLLWASLFYIVFYLLLGPLFLLSGPEVMLGFLFCLVYALIPDLDLKSSWIKGQFNTIVIYSIIILSILFFVTGVIGLILAAGFLVIIEIFLQFIKHRGVLHSPIVGIILSIPLYFINYPSLGFFIAGVIGYASHWIVDKF
jgi:uncharacterized metal-binding protein